MKKILLGLVLPAVVITDSGAMENSQQKVTQSTPLGAVEQNAESNLTENQKVSDIEAAILSGQNDLVEEIITQEKAKKDNIEMINKILNLGIFAAAQSNNAVACNILLNNGALVNVKGDRGMVPLHIAAINNSKDVAELIIKKIATGFNSTQKLNASDTSANTPLYYAITNNSRDVAELIIRALWGGLKVNYNIDDRDKYGNTLLDYAIMSDIIDMAELLISKGARVNNDSWRGKAPLYHAVCRNSQAMVELLVKHGADAKVGDLLYYAALNNNPDMVAFLISMGAKVNVQGNHGKTPLHIAAENNSRAIVELLLNNSAKVNPKDGNWHTPLACAVHRGARDVIELLISKGADISDMNYQEGKVVKNSGKVGDLLSKIDGVSQELHDFVRRDSIDEFNALLDKEELARNIIVSTDYKKKLLYLAVDSNSPKMCEFLTSRLAGTGLSWDLDRLLYVAAEHDMRAIGEILIKAGADVYGDSQLGSDKMTPLHIAAQHNSKEMGELLIDKMGYFDERRNFVLEGEKLTLGQAGDRISRGRVFYINDNVCGMEANENRDGRTPLYYALGNNSKDMIELLICKGAFRGLRGMSRLHVAAKYGSLKIFNFVIDRYTDVNITDSFGRTPLHFAAQSNSREICEKLIILGADINAKDKNGETPLNYAYNNSRYEMADFLRDAADFQSKLRETLEDKSQTNEEKNELFSAINEAKDEIADALILSARYDDNKTLLHIAAENDLPEIGDFLINKGIDIEAESISGLTALHVAAQHNSVKMGEFLINKGAKLNVQNKSGLVPLHIAAQNDSKEMGEILVSKGAAINVKNGWGYTPLHWAVESNARKMIQFFISKGMDINTRDNSGKTSLHIVAEKDDKAMSDYLMTFPKIDINAKDNDGRTPLHYAVQYNSGNVGESLINKEARINAKDNKGWTPLHIAVSKNSRPMVSMLTQKAIKVNFFSSKCADLNVKDTEGKTPLHIAAENNSQKMVDLLLRKGAKVNIVDNQGNTPQAYNPKLFE